MPAFFGVDFRQAPLHVPGAEFPAHMEQLMIYAALFCLEYKIKPAEIGIELRLYQNNEILYHNPTVEEIVPIIDKIVTFDKIINKIKEQEG